MFEKTRLCVASVMSLWMLTGCFHGDVADDEQGNESQVSELSTVVARRGTITPTLSARAQVTQLARYVVNSPERGEFTPLVGVGDLVSAGQVIGHSAGKEVLAPSDAEVVGVAKKGRDLPQNYPILELEYSGFALNVELGRFRQVVGSEGLNGRYQIPGGVGPTECAAVVQASSSTDEGRDADSTGPGQEQTSGEQTPGRASVASNASVVSCLIDKATTVVAGEEATVVLTATTRKDVILVPVSAVSGRVEAGRVNLVRGAEVLETEVQLGASDGANIEIVSGLDEGAVVSAVSPDLDPRRK